MLVAVWFVISQLPLVMVTLAALVWGPGSSVFRRASGYVSRHSAAGSLLTLLIGIVGVALALNAGTYLAFGRFIPG